MPKPQTKGRTDVLFYVNITVRIPQGFDPEEVKSLTTREHQRAQELEAKGKWLHVWRVVGKWANVSIFEVEGNAELHEILTSLPLYPFMEIEVTPLCEMRPATKNDAT
jgi:muconolactone D-isomerase